jgi:hypothetical protein
MWHVPFETSPSDIAFYMSLLEKSQRVHPQALDFYTSKNIQRLGRQFSKQANKADAELGPLNQEFKLILSALGFIRRTVNLRWFGHAIIELPPNNRMDVPCPIRESYLATIRPMDSVLSTELDRIGAARAEGQENRFRLSAAGIIRALYAANCPSSSTDVVETFLSKELKWERTIWSSRRGSCRPWAHPWSPRPRRLALLPQTKKFLGLSKKSIPSIRDLFEKGK